MYIYNENNQRVVVSPSPVQPAKKVHFAKENYGASDDKKPKLLYVLLAVFAAILVVYAIVWMLRKNKNHDYSESPAASIAASSVGSTQRFGFRFF